MKVKTYDGDVEFKPVKVQLTIESENELLELYHRLNISMDVIKKNRSKYVSLPSNEGSVTRIFWEAVEKLCKSRKLHREI